MEQIYSLIFREEFAKLICGNEKVRPDSINWISNWEWKLEQFLKSKDKWKFLEENIDFN